MVIAILAAITIVSFNGVQQRAKTSASISTVDQVSKKATAWSTTQSSYPDLAQLRTNSITPTDIDTPGGDSGPLEAKLTSPNVAIGATMNETRSENGNVITYEPCWGGSSHTGARISYWDFTKSQTTTVTAGNC